MPWCNECGEYVFSNKHKCSPIFEVKLSEDDEWKEVRAVDYDNAVEKFCEIDDAESADYRIAHNGWQDGIQCRKQGEEEIKKFNVSAQQTIEYRATEVE